MERQRDLGGVGHQHKQYRPHRRRLVGEGIAAALTRKYNPNSARPRIFDGAAEAKLIALTCSPAPEGFARRSFAPARGEGVELNIVGRTLKNVLKPHRNRQWVIPPDANAGFVAAMEDWAPIH